METATKGLSWKKGWLIFGVSWVVTLLAVALLRQSLVPAQEMACYHRVNRLQKAVDRWNLAHPEKKMTDEIDEEALAKEGLWKSGDYDPQQHYYFVDETAHGPKVKCNRHEDNPLLLRLTGVTLLAVLVFVGFCYLRGLVLFGKN